MSKVRKHPAFFRGIVIAVLVLAAGAAYPRTADEEFEYAVTLYKKARWAGAFGRFSALADRGHPEAARIALFMVRYGGELHGSRWTATQDQIDHWISLAARNPVKFVPESGD